MTREEGILFRWYIFVDFQGSFQIVRVNTENVDQAKTEMSGHRFVDIIL